MLTAALAFADEEQAAENVGEWEGLLKLRWRDAAVAAAVRLCEAGKAVGVLGEKVADFARALAGEDPHAALLVADCLCVADPSAQQPLAVFSVACEEVKAWRKKGGQCEAESIRWAWLGRRSLGRAAEVTETALAATVRVGRGAGGGRSWLQECIVRS